MKTIYTDVYGVHHSTDNNTWFVCATDKMLSGWGRAEGKISKRVVICNDRETAFRVADNMMKSSFIYVNCHRGHLPYYRPSRYVVSINHADDCPLWNK
jgi:hypothetical protein